MTSTSSTIQQINVWKDGKHKFDDTKMMSVYSNCMFIISQLALTYDYECCVCACLFVL